MVIQVLGLPLRLRKSKCQRTQKSETKSSIRYQDRWKRAEAEDDTRHAGTIQTCGGIHTEKKRMNEYGGEGNTY